MEPTFPRPLVRPTRALDLVELVSGTLCSLEGDATAVVSTLAALDDADGTSLAFCSEKRPKLAGRRIAASAAGIVVCTPKARVEGGRTLLRTADPFLWFTRALLSLFPPPASAGIHATAVVSPDADIGSGVEVGAYAVIEAGAVVGANTRIGPHCVVRGGSHIGDLCVVGAGAQLGGAGLAVAYGDDGAPYSFPHLGRLRIAADVQIGAGSIIMRGMLKDTVVGSGTRIGNRVTIGHNCTVGDRAWISAGAVLAGSCTIGAHAMIGANASVKNKVTIGKNAQVGMGSVATRSVPDGQLVFGVPATALPGAFRF